MKQRIGVASDEFLQSLVWNHKNANQLGIDWKKSSLRLLRKINKEAKLYEELHK